MDFTISSALFKKGFLKIAPLSYGYKRFKCGRMWQDWKSSYSLWLWEFRKRSHHLESKRAEGTELGMSLCVGPHCSKVCKGLRYHRIKQMTLTPCVGLVPAQRNKNWGKNMFAVESKTSLEQSSGCFSLFFFLTCRKRLLLSFLGKWCTIVQLSFSTEYMLHIFRQQNGIRYWWPKVKKEETVGWIVHVKMVSYD